MSEYQYVAFRAVEGPVSDKNLEFMRRQSSRAEVTPWTFANEYHFGDFHGNAQEMLRRGYDLHLHYANFGTRHLMIRLPQGLPDPEAARAYLGKDALQFLKDKQGPGGILSIDPCFEPGQLEEIWEPQGLLDRLVPLRAEILDGDLRPLYLVHLAVAGDMNHDPEETREGPVPAGLQKLSAAQAVLAEFYGLDESLIAAAAQNSPPLPGRDDPGQRYLAWLEQQPEATKNAWLAELLADPKATVRSQILAELRRTNPASGWPTIGLNRTIAELQAAAAVLHQQAKDKAAEKAARQRAKKLAAMAANPETTIKETEQLVKQRGTHAYQQIAKLLADLRTALADGPKAGLAEQQARKLKNDNPSLNLLTSELRRAGLLAK